MAKAKADALPEILISTGTIVDLAKDALAARGRTTEATAKEETAKKTLTDEAEVLQVAEMQKDNYVGLLRITADQNLPPVRVEFRIENGALDIDQEPELDRLFGASKPLLFSKEKVISEVVDPQALVDGLVKAGQNPWDFFELKTKKGMETLGEMCEKAALGSVKTAEAILPNKGFLTTMNDVGKNLNDEAKEYVKAYLKQTLAPRTVLGSKAKGDA